MMLRKSLEILLVSLSTILTPSYHYSAQNFNFGNKPTYAASEPNLNQKLQEEADKLEEKKLRDTIKSYQNKIQKGIKLREDEIIKVGESYRKLVIDIAGSESDIKEALKFFESVPYASPKSSYVPRAHLNYAEIICCVLGEYSSFIVRMKLEEALRLAKDNKTRAEALYLLGSYYLNQDDAANKEKGKKSLYGAIKLVPGSDTAEKAESLLREHEKFEKEQKEKAAREMQWIMKEIEERILKRDLQTK